MDNTTIMLICSAVVATILMITYIVMRQKTTNRNIADDIATIKGDKNTH